MPLQTLFALIIVAASSCWFGYLSVGSPPDERRKHLTQLLAALMVGGGYPSAAPCCLSDRGSGC